MAVGDKIVISNKNNILLEKIKEVDGDGSGLDADLLRGLPADFTNDLSENGYQILPSGLIIQWGRTGHINDSTTVEVTFPITFPTAVFTCYTTAGVSSDSGGSVANVRSDTLTTSKVSVRNGDGDTSYEYITWLAIGH